MNYRRALWFARQGGNFSLGLGGAAAAGMTILAGIQAYVDQWVAAVFSLLLGALYVLLAGFGYALCAALHHYLFSALGAVDDESPDQGRRRRA